MERSRALGFVEWFSRMVVRVLFMLALWLISSLFFDGLMH